MGRIWRSKSMDGCTLESASLLPGRLTRPMTTRMRAARGRRDRSMLAPFMVSLDAQQQEAGGIILSAGILTAYWPAVTAPVCGGEVAVASKEIGRGPRSRVPAKMTLPVC